MNRLKGARVAFLQENAINESLGLCDLAGHLRTFGVSTRLFLSREERGLRETLRRFDPAMVIIPCDLLGHNSALRLARTAKSATEAKVLLGGTHPTFFPNVVLREGVDYAFAGEAEGVVTDVLAALLGGEDPAKSLETIPNLIRRRNGNYHPNPIRPVLEDLDDLALPDREIYYRYPFIASFEWKKFSTGRGCLNSCGFCFNPAYRSMLSGKRTFFRRKSPERIVREIEAVRRRHPLEIVHFSDDLFSSGTDWLEAFIACYGDTVALPFSCNVFARSVNRRTGELLRRGGCRVIAMGVEVADESLRMEVMNKPVSTEEIIEAARIVKDLGIRLVTFNILGLPWSSLETDMETLDLNRRIQSDHTRLSILVPFPKSAVTARLHKEGYLAEDFEDRIYEIPDLPRWPAESLFRRSRPESTVRLYRLWPLMLALGLPKRWVRRLVESRWSVLLNLLSLLVVLTNEKKIFALGWLSGFRYFLHVRNPALKTTNYVSFI